MPRVNLTRQVKTETGWKRVALERDGRGRIKWGNGDGRYLIEWREEGRRVREAAGATPSEALEAQRRKRLELEARQSNLELLGLPNEEENELLDRARVHVSAKPEYNFVPKDWEERSVPLGQDVVDLLKHHPHLDRCPLVFPSPNGKPNYRFLHDRCKAVAKRAKLNPKEWYLHRFRDTAATRWLRGGIDVRTVQGWLGHESLDTMQRYLEPSTETERQLDNLPLPF